MKKRYLLIAGLCCFLLMSCDKFLELTPRDQKVVSTIEDYRDIMASYMRLLKTPNPTQERIFGVDAFAFPLFDVAINLGVYTGETNLTINSSSYYDKVKGAYTNEGKNMLSWLKTDSQAWARYYRFLGPINLIISGIADAEGTDEDLRNRVKGEALVWRAFAYFKLLQYYAPYKDNTYGIPIYLTPEQDIGTAMPERKTQQEVFARIFEDCGEALDLLDRTASSEWNCAWRNDFIHAMMASIYTWRAMSGAAETNDWENAEKCATEAMKGRILSNTAEAMKELFNCKGVSSETYLESDEFYFRIIDGSNRQIFDFVYAYYESFWGGPSDGRANQMYYGKFKEGDIRKTAWFNEAGTHSDKYNLTG
ncbi:MAG: RagB/SusD family nutrient uptake outer membrane protein, partial [Odoribacter sp.]|nr:RagB/SusD family nutrient uptake outer membrane protein [Odoribacter sp.]